MSKAPKTKSGMTNGAPKLSKLSAPKGVETEKLGGGFRPEGFLIAPTKDDPKPCAIAGVLVAMGTKESTKRGFKDNEWGVLLMLEDQEHCQAFDKETGEVFTPKKGQLIGVSKKGGLHGMREEKIGHWVGVEYTGEQIEMGKGKSPMWEVIAEVSKEVYREVSP